MTAKEKLLMSAARDVVDYNTFCCYAIYSLGFSKQFYGTFNLTTDFAKLFEIKLGKLKWGKPTPKHQLQRSLAILLYMETLK